MLIIAFLDKIYINLNKSKKNIRLASLSKVLCILLYIIHLAVKHLWSKSEKISVANR